MSTFPPIQYQIRNKLELNPKNYFSGSSTRAKRRREVYKIIARFDDMTATIVEVRKVMKQYLRKHIFKKLSLSQKRLYICYSNSLRGHRVRVALVKLISAGLIVQIK